MAGHIECAKAHHPKFLGSLKTGKKDRSGPDIGRQLITKNNVSEAIAKGPVAAEQGYELLQKTTVQISP